jgi:hypothetical protein
MIIQNKNEATANATATAEVENNKYKSDPVARINYIYVKQCFRKLGLGLHLCKSAIPYYGEIDVSTPITAVLIRPRKFKLIKDRYNLIYTPPM